MSNSNSPLISTTILSPNHSGLRNHKIDTITIHCMAGNLSVELCGKLFQNPNRQASSNYGIGSDGRIALYVEEKNRSWCSSSKSNDHRAVTIEVANCTAGPSWRVTDEALHSLIELVADICKRNKIKELRWVGDKSLIGCVDLQNLTVHRWFATKACPGEYLYEQHPFIVQEVNKKLGEVISLDMTKEELKKFIEDTVKMMGVGEPADSWASDLVNKSVELGISDGSNPKRLATREEVMIMASRAVGR